MPTPPPIHLCIIQPVGYVHSLGFLDQARYVRWQLRRMGVTVTLAKNRLREDAVNLVFGAHLGFPPSWRERHACLFFNLEQLGQGGAELAPEYLQLLKTSAVVDYDTANVSAYAVDAGDVPILPFLHAPYLRDPETSIPLEDRPIDLLFFGSMNEHRRAFLRRVEASGINVAMFDGPVYGPERDQFIRQAKAVLNCHFYDASRFEQARTSLCLSMGTPVISERRGHEQVPAAFEHAVHWVQGPDVETFFRDHFGRAAFFEQSRAQLDAWTHADALEPYADLVGFAAGYLEGHRRGRSGQAWQPTCINLGSGKDYKAGWLNVDILDRAEPDLLLDLGQAHSWPLMRASRFGGSVLIAPASIDRVYANNVLEHVPDLPMLMGNVLTLLKTGGTFEIEVPYEKALTAWQDPTHLRALNENSWVYYTEWFWYLGWFEHRFEIAEAIWLDMSLQPCAKEQAAFMRVTLRKVETTPRERTTARTMQADFGGVADDLPPDIDVLADALEPAAVATTTV
jgi:hypothetical protein